MRRTILLALVVAAAAAAGIGAGNASAVCEPEYRPLCMSDCPTGTPNIKEPTDFSWLFRMCPHSL